jgi:hypothetical protein
MVLVLALAVVAIVIGYLAINGKRNSDPLNRKCAAEICEYLTRADTTDLNVEIIREIFMRNARYRKQAYHIVSMVPLLLISEGYPKDAATSVAPLLRVAADGIPR